MRRRRLAGAAVLVLMATAACSATTSPPATPSGVTVTYRAALPLSVSELAGTVARLQARLPAFGVSGAQVHGHDGEVVVHLAKAEPRPLLDAIGSSGRLSFRPVWCEAAAYTAAGSSAPSAPLPTCGATYRLTAANLDVNTSTGVSQGSVAADPAFAAFPSTSPTEDATSPGRTVLLPGAESSGCTPRCVLGPAAVTDTGIDQAQAQRVAGTWTVLLTFTPAGSVAWDRLARQQFHAQVGIDVDGTVVSAPITLPAQSTFTSFGGRVQISGDFSGQSAKDLATDLRTGPLPLPLVVASVRLGG